MGPRLFPVLGNLRFTVSFRVLRYQMTDDGIRNQVNEKDLQLRKQQGQKDRSYEEAWCQRRGDADANHSTMEMAPRRDGTRGTVPPKVYRRAGHFLIASARRYVSSLKRSFCHPECVRMFFRRTGHWNGNSQFPGWFSSHEHGWWSLHYYGFPAAVCWNYSMLFACMQVLEISPKTSE